MSDNNYKIYENSKGDKVPRVSDILKMLNKEQLLYWANSLGYKHISYAHELERTAKIGSMVHDMIDTYHSPKKLATYNWYKYKIYTRYDKISVFNCMMSFRKWYDKYGYRFIILHTELSVIGEFFGGTIDTIIKSPLNKNKNHVVIVDYKTSSSIHMTQVLQLSAYVYLCETVLGYTVDGVMVLRMDKKRGDEAEDRFVPREELDVFISLFLNLYQTWLLNSAVDSVMKKKKTTFKEVIL